MDYKKVIKKFKTLTEEEQEIFCIFMLDDMIIAGRETYVVGSIEVSDPIKLRMINELKHQIMNKLKNLIFNSKGKGGPLYYSDESFFQMIFNEFESFGFNLSRLNYYFERVEYLTKNH